jgi:hypothetical protein
MSVTSIPSRHSTCTASIMHTYHLEIPSPMRRLACGPVRLLQEGFTLCKAAAYSLKHMRRNPLFSEFMNGMDNGSQAKISPPQIHPSTHAPTHTHTTPSAPSTPSTYTQHIQHTHPARPAHPAHAPSTPKRFVSVGHSSQPRPTAFSQDNCKCWPRLSAIVHAHLHNCTRTWL